MVGLVCGDGWDGSRCVVDNLMGDDWMGAGWAVKLEEERTDSQSNFNFPFTFKFKFAFSYL